MHPDGLFEFTLNCLHAETSDSVGVPKKIPVSRKSMRIYTKYTITRLTALANACHKDHYGKNPPIGHGFNQLEIVDRTLPDGTPLGNISGSAVKYDIRRNWGDIVYGAIE